jgi:sporulation protein YlmC with PRC-barrel domain
MSARCRTVLHAVCLVAALGAGEAASGADAPVRVMAIIGSLVMQPHGSGVAGSVTDVFIDPVEHRVVALALDVDGRPRICGVNEIDFAGEAAANQRRPLRMPESCGKGAGTTPAAVWRRASEVTAAHVRDRGDAVVGEVKDLYVDPASGRVTHALVDFVPAWFPAEGWAAVPMASLQPQGKGYLAAFDPAVLRPSQPAKAAPPAPPRAVDVRLSKLLGRTVMDPGGRALGRVTELEIDLDRGIVVMAQVQSAGGKVECAVGAGGLSLGPDALRAPATALTAEAGCGAARIPGDARRIEARALLAAGVRDEGGETVGRLRDVVVSLDTGKLHYLVADFDAGWVRDGDVVALPLRRVERDGKDLYVRASLMELQQRPVFPGERLADVWSPVFAKGMDKYLYGR